MKKKLGIALLVAALAGLAWAVSAAGGELEELRFPGPHPFKTDEKGRVDLDSIPEQMPVLNEAGEVVGHVSRDELIPQPPARQGE